MHGTHHSSTYSFQYIYDVCVVRQFKYMLMVPANRLGYVNGFNGFQLKITQEVITLVVFSVFAILYLKEPFHWKYLVSFILILGAVYFAFKD